MHTEYKKIFISLSSLDFLIALTESRGLDITCLIAGLRRIIHFALGNLIYCAPCLVLIQFQCSIQKSNYILL